MPDRSPLASELFQFTIEETVLMPEALDQLLPAHIKQQQALGAASLTTPAAPVPITALTPIVAAPPSSLAAHPPSSEAAATNVSGGV
ncbi:hypothetical protein EON65_03980 [archaeon]|nr:MAG: hypothetical protein EON65_03980 [archaeon]